MNLVRYKSDEDLARTLSLEISRDLKRADAPFLILPGGSSPRLLMMELSRIPMDWDNIIITSSDERCVPISSEESCIGQVATIMGKKPGLIPLWSETEGIRPLPRGVATVAVLGMGEDGHFASIFPGMVWDEKAALACFVSNAPKPPSQRVTLPVKIFLQARRLILLVCGAEKVRLVEQILDGSHASLPVARLIGMRNDMEIHMAA